jgi:hypothetical protein
MSETSNSWTGPTLLDLMSYVEDTPANPLASPVRVKAKKIRATSGLGYDTPLAFYDPVTQSLKMYEATCPLAELPSLQKLPSSGTAQNGVLYLQPPWEPITDVIDSSLLHAPTGKMNQMSPSMSGRKRQSGWWPTPVAKGGLDGGAHSRDSMTKLQGTPFELPSTGKLNPAWVEWLMGFPIGWTDLED